MTPNAIRLLKFAHWIDIDESLRFDVSNSSKHYISKELYTPMAIILLQGLLMKILIYDIKQPTPSVKKNNLL